MATQSSSQSSSSFQGIENPEALAILLNLLRSGGASSDYQAQRSRRNAATTALEQLMQNYSTDAAFSDAAQLMQLNLQQSLEKQMPAIARAVQGAGTSASSMQGLLSNKIAQDSALSAGALGAEQAKAYANVLASMSGTMEEFTRIDDTLSQNLIKALSLMQVGRSSSSGSSSGSSDGGSRSSGGGGGGFSGGRTVGGVGNTGAVVGSPWAPSHFNPGPGDVGSLSNPFASSPASEDPFFYDDWGVGSTASGDMAANPSASSGGGGGWGWGDWGETTNTSWDPNAGSGYTGEDFSPGYDIPWSGDSGGYW